MRIVALTYSDASEIGFGWLPPKSNSMLPVALMSLTVGAVSRNPRRELRAEVWNWGWMARKFAAFVPLAGRGMAPLPSASVGAPPLVVPWMVS
jgi:hypothetical protein